MLFLAALSFIGGTIFMVTRTDLGITANYKTEIEAFQQADAGVQYVKDQIDAALGAGTLLLTAPTETVNITPPNGFSFDPVTQLTQTGNTNAYMFEVVGHSQDSEATVEAVVHRTPLMEFGLFGDEQVDLKPNANVYSFDSGVNPLPGPGDSDGRADAASNEEFITGNGTYLDGSLALGEDSSGNQAVWRDKNGGATITGYEGQEISRIDPDPLGASGGDLAATFTTVAGANDNASAGISGNKINLGNGKSITLTAGDYYLTDLVLKNGAELVVDASAGPVNIYLTGAMEAKNGSQVNYLPAGSTVPTDFFIYSNSNKDLTLKNGGDFKGSIYAPGAFVEVKNSGNFYGAIWGETAEVKNSGNIFIDVALLNRAWGSSVYLASWKEVRH
jgi:hypothetical protein